MKIKNLILIFAVIATTFSSCKKEAGPTGPAGTNGNANVTSLTFTNPITGGTLWYDTLKGVTYQSISSSLVLAYIQDANCGNNWYSMPGWGCGANYAGRFYTAQVGGTDTTTTMAYLELLNPDGSYGVSSQTLTKLRVIVAPAGTTLTGKKEIDYADYKATCRYFNIGE